MNTLCTPAALMLFFGSLLPAASASFTGTWKADIAKSNFEGHPPVSELMILEQETGSIKEIVGETSQRGEYRASYVYLLDGKESANEFRGLPMKSKVSLEGTTFTIDSEVAGPHPTKIHQKYTLSEDGNTMQIAGTMNMNGKDTVQTIVFDRQPDAAAEALRKPEETAGAKYKNVKLLQDLPASRFIDTMRYFTVALGVDCEHCHVQGHFDSDDKKEKRFARTMITMTRNIDEQTFHGHPAVRCFTCHRGNEKPVSQVPFEAAKLNAP